MKEIKTIDAIGHVICHDITQIIKGEVKHSVFKKGHVVREEDIPVLLSVGKDHLYVYEVEEGMIHEDEAAEILKEMTINEHMSPSGPHEGKIDLFAEVDGLFKVDIERLLQINLLGEMMIATRHNNMPVKKGDHLLGTRIIPLIIEKEKMEKAKNLCDGPLTQLLPFHPLKVGVVTTGNEVFYGRIKDTFTPVIIDKVHEFGMEVVQQELTDDNKENIEQAIRRVMDAGVDVVLCTGGMSVDPDDKTPAAIRQVAPHVISYGAPVLPGAMFMLAYTETGMPIMGLPGCVMYCARTVFDLILPRIAAKDPITTEELAALGHGGLCLHCEVCQFPNCTLGKGA